MNANLYQNMEMIYNKRLRAGVKASSQSFANKNVPNQPNIRIRYASVRAPNIVGSLYAQQATSQQNCGLRIRLIHGSGPEVSTTVRYRCSVANNSADAALRRGATLQNSPILAVGAGTGPNARFFETDAAGVIKHRSRGALVVLQPNEIPSYEQVRTIHRIAYLCQYFLAEALRLKNQDPQFLALGLPEQRRMLDDLERDHAIAWNECLLETLGSPDFAGFLPNHTFA